MELYVVRHGQSMANLEERHAGYLPVELSPLGREQAEKARKTLEGISFDRVYCSDLVRAKQTAAIALPDYEPVYTPRLREICVGKLEGMTYRECEERYGQDFFDAEARQDYSRMGGETGEELRDRIHGFLRELESHMQLQRVAVFGHEGTVRETLNFALGTVIPLEHMVIRNAAVSVFSIGPEGRKLLGWNQTKLG